MNLDIIKKLNELGVDTSIKFSISTGKWYVFAAKLEIKDGNFLTSICSHGDTIEQAVAEFNLAVIGKRLVSNAYSSDRCEFCIL
jgi:hypothetical protein